MINPSRLSFLSSGQALLFVLLVCCAALYWPGLSGSLLLDDQANLGKLQKLSGPLSLDQLGAFIASGHAGPLGRPLSMLSFALQFESWPDNPAAFKLVNLLLHLANGGLVFWLTLLLTKGNQSRAPVFPALLLTAVWLLHPIQVSTTLYIVQRMTLLASLFTLAGLVAIFQGRHLIAAGRPRAGYSLATGGLLLGGLLAILSKESGVLLPVFALVIEVTLYSHRPLSRDWRIWKYACLALPVLLGLCYLAINFKLLANHQLRAFSLEERLLTEGRIVLDYLRKILLIPPYDFGVFFDDFKLSRSLLSPPSTLLALAGLGLLLGTALKWRGKAPFFAFGILWFFAGHALESTVLPLELYFEHRNYLPSFGILLGVVFGVRELAAATPKLSRLYPALALSGLLIAGSLTWQQTRLWGDSLTQAVVWAHEKPHSQRAQERAGVMLALAGYREPARDTFARISLQFPESANGPVLLLYHQCLYEVVEADAGKHLVRRIAAAEHSSLVLSTLAEIVRFKENRRCNAVSFDELQAYFDAVLDNPRYAGRMASLLILRGRAYWAAGAPEAAFAALDTAFKRKPDKEIALLQLTWATAIGDKDRIARYLASARAATTGDRRHDALIDRQLQAVSSQAAGRSAH